MCFSAEFKLRTVIWDFAGDPLPTDVCDDLGGLDEHVLAVVQHEQRRLTADDVGDDRHLLVAEGGERRHDAVDALRERASPLGKR